MPIKKIGNSGRTNKASDCFRTGDPIDTATGGFSF
jgi:hypothetical protein